MPETNAVAVGPEFEPVNVVTLMIRMLDFFAARRRSLLLLCDCRFVPRSSKVDFRAATPVGLFLEGRLFDPLWLGNCQNRQSEIRPILQIEYQVVGKGSAKPEVVGFPRQIRRVGAPVGRISSIQILPQRGKLMIGRPFSKSDFQLVTLVILHESRSLNLIFSHCIFSDNRSDYRGV